jgi:hypothetical protein
MKHLGSALLVPVALALAAAGSSLQSAPPPTAHHVEYLVNGSAQSAGLTYRNRTGGTEQNDTALPATMSFDAPGGSFVYLSAQNKTGSGTVHVAISVDGELVQEATSSSPHGIATAHARIPR